MKKKKKRGKEGVRREGEGERKKEGSNEISKRENKCEECMKKMKKGNK